MFRLALVLLSVVSVAFAQTPPIDAKALRTELKAALDKFSVPALGVAVVTSEGVFLQDVLGVRKRGDETPVSLADLWHLGSDSKAMTATVIARLVERKLLSYDLTFAKAFPELADKMDEGYRNVTIAQALTHRAGLPANPSDDWLIKTQADPVVEARYQLISSILAQKPHVKPGSKFEYSNVGYILVACLAERTTKTAWEKLIAQELFEPLKITTAGQGPAGTVGKVDQPYPHSDKGKPIEDLLKSDNVPVYSSAGRVHMSLGDWGKFIADHLRGSRGQKALLAADLYAKMNTPAKDEEYAPGGWGVILNKRGNLFAHDGSNGNNYASALVMPSANIAILVVCNQGGDKGQEATHELRQAIIRRIFPGSTTEKPKPKVLLIGDSIRVAYAPLVEKALPELAIISPSGAGDSGWLLKNLENWILETKPEIVHFNVGLHDLRKDRKSEKHQISLEEYEKNLQAIVTRLKKTNATIIMTLTTPVDDQLGKKRKGSFDRLNADVEAYNAVALRVAKKFDVIVHDLYAVTMRHGGSKLLSNDGTHFKSDGVSLQAEAVADCLRRHLLIRNTKANELPKADESATIAYTAAQKKRDGEVRDVYRKRKVPEFVIPSDGAEWSKRRPEVVKTVESTLGDLPSLPEPSAKVVSIERRPARGYVVESLRIPNGEEEMTALWLAPDNLGTKKAPAILWLHSSSYDSRQLLMTGFNGGEEPLGETFTKAGYVVLAPDACWYGGRAGQGPGGSSETPREQHDSLFKYNLWLGRTLWGMFVRDDRIALNYLCTRSEVDTSRIGATGISMGSTRSWWLAALDQRIKCVVGVACLTRYQNLLAHGELRQHGVYYYVLGLLKHFDIEGVLALIAPRPFLALTGELDGGSPADGIRVIEDRLGKIYSVLGAKERFRSVLYKHTGHVYTPAMRKEMLGWFARWLKDAK